MPICIVYAMFGSYGLICSFFHFSIVCIYAQFILIDTQGHSDMHGEDLNCCWWLLLFWQLRGFHKIGVMKGVAI